MCGAETIGRVAKGLAESSGVVVNPFDGCCFYPEMAAGVVLPFGTTNTCTHAVLKLGT